MPRHASPQSEVGMASKNMFNLKANWYEVMILDSKTLTEPKDISLWVMQLCFLQTQMAGPLPWWNNGYRQISAPHLSSKCSSSLDMLSRESTCQNCDTVHDHTTAPSLSLYPNICTVSIFYHNNIQSWGWPRGKGPHHQRPRGGAPVPQWSWGKTRGWGGTLCPWDHTGNANRYLYCAHSHCSSLFLFLKWPLFLKLE